LTNESEASRDDVELALFALGFSLDLLEEGELRIRQAIQRTALVADVLDPALDRLEMVRRQVKMARGVVRELWRTGQAGKWKRE
jgi:hypothetical protein